VTNKLIFGDRIPPMQSRLENSINHRDKWEVKYIIYTFMEISQ
jgi:hypothetical protein